MARAKAKTVSPNARQLRVALVWNGTVQWEEQLLVPSAVVLGNGGQFALPASVGVDKLVVLEPAGAGYRFLPSEHVGGAIFLSGERNDARSMPGPTQLGPDDYGVLQIGEIALFFQSVRPMANNLRTGLELDAALIGCIALAAFLVLSFLVVLRLEGDARPRIVDGVLDPNADIVRDFMVTPPPPPERQTAVISGNEERTPGRESPSESSGRRSRNEEGRVGRQDAQQENTQIAGEQNEQIATRVRSLGLLGALAGPDGNPLAQALNLPTTSDILGGMGNVQNITGRGTGGAGLRGTGTGGGGTGNGGLFASGGVGNGSGGVGLSNGQGGGGTGAPGRPRAEVAVRVGAGRPAASGGLSAEQIQRVVRQNASAIRYCYETQVQRRPNLRGQISIGFTISQSGSVASARVANSSMGSPDVEGCIVRVWRRMRFPASDSGDSRGTFPFNFSAGG